MTSVYDMTRPSELDTRVKQIWLSTPKNYKIILRIVRLFNKYYKDLIHLPLFVTKDLQYPDTKLNEK